MCSSHVNAFGRLTIEATADSKPDVTIDALAVSEKVIESALNLLSWNKKSYYFLSSTICLFIRVWYKGYVPF